MKIAIIGAGTIGLYLALKLSERGEEIFLFEKKQKVGKEVCSGLFSERILDFLPESKSLIENEINCCFLHFPKKTLKVNFFKKFFVINHSKLDNLIFSKVKKTKTKIFLGKEIKEIPKNFDRVIGCDGANSTIREILSLKNPQFFLGIQGFLKKENFSHFVETWPTQNGFLWKIPRGKEIEYGVIEKPKEAKTIFEKFLKKNNLSLENIKSALISQGLALPKNKKITLCGEAMGLTKPWSGGGVIWGLISANILLKNFPDFLKYKKEVEKFFLPQIIFSKLAKFLVYFLGFNFPKILKREYEIDGDLFNIKRHFISSNF